jgi:hypothetical protein
VALVKLPIILVPEGVMHGPGLPGRANKRGDADQAESPNYDCR